MIKVVKHNIDPPNSLIDERCLISFSEVINSDVADHKEKINRNIYSAPDVRLALSALYHNKCAYCETFDPAYQVEHYRPKKGVNGTHHSGYYWLSYEWSNLLPACYHCNSPGNKGNHFRLRSEHRRVNYTANPGDQFMLLEELKESELPLLINPEEKNFDPYVYFKFNYGCEMKPKGNPGAFNYERAHYTIETIGLNREAILRLVRQAEVKSLKGKIYRLLALKGQMTEQAFNSLFKGYLDEIKDKRDATLPYTFWWEYFLKNLDNLLFKRFDARTRTMLLEKEEQYLNGTLNI